MQVITIVQTKGGSGKTTSAMLLASAALDAGRRVTLIDGDVNAQLGRCATVLSSAPGKALSDLIGPTP